MDFVVMEFYGNLVKTKILDKSGYKTNSFEAPEVSPMRMTLAEEMLTRSAGESVYGSKSPAARAGEEAKKDLLYLDEVITRREEAMCAEALFSGRVTSCNGVLRELS